MLEATDSEWAPWFLADSNDKRRARLNIISHLLDHVPYEAIHQEAVELPARQKRAGYREPDRPSRWVPARH